MHYRNVTAAVRDMVQSVDGGFEVFVGLVSDHYREVWTMNRKGVEARCRQMLDPSRTRGPRHMNADLLPKFVATFCEEHGAKDLVTPILLGAVQDGLELRRLHGLNDQAEPEPRITIESAGSDAVGFVYFVQVGSDGPVKVGASRDEATLGKRLSALQTSHYETLHLISSVPIACVRVEGKAPSDCFEAERAFHERFSEHSIRGEWFSPAPDVLRMAEVGRQIRKVEPPERWREVG